MRSGNSALQQTLTPEAASVLKHSLVLARRRGHAQLTPLHVATTLLTLRLSSFTTACLKSQPHQPSSHSHSHSHPLQCRALELCFNVALNRLPTTPTPLIHSQPSLSNALIAALKRAQAHQRRGSIEQQQQQQSLLTVKVELEQLIISILDDPSVSRVMREAGFSSTLVKNNIEEENSSVSAPNSVFRCYNSSGGVFSSPCSPSTSENNHKESHQNTIHNHHTSSSSSSFRQKHFLSAYEFNQVLFSPPKKAQAYSDKDEKEIKLGLTLHASSDKEQEDKLNCCEECVSNYEKEAEFLIPEQNKTLPFWLHSHTTQDYKKDELTELKRKWNRLCNCLHQNKQPQNNWTNSNLNNLSSSISFANKATTSSNLVPRFRRQQSCIIEFNFNDNKKQSTEPFIDSLERMEKGKEVKITLGLGNDTSGETVGNLTDTTLLQLEAHVCKLLQENVPWQSETIPSIAKALVHSKSEKEQSNIKWLLLQGNDSIGKRRLVVSIAESVFGSADLVLHLDMLKKETSIVSFSEMVEGALRSHHKLVVLIENVDFADTQFMKYLSDAYETGKFGTLSSIKEKSNQVIFILTNGDTTKTEEQNQNSVMKLLWQITETKTSCLGHKRRAELDLFTNIKSLKIEEGIKGNFSRQSSFNALDLNMKADEEIEGQSQSQSSLISNEFLGSIENKFEFNMNSARQREMEEMFMSKIKGSFEEICGKEFLVNFSVDERVVKEICVGCYFLTNSLFEKWLKDIFQSSLETVNFGGKEGILFRLCWGGGKEGDRKWDSGFKGSFLPKSIQVNYFIE